ncbi:MAG: DUF4238 domain-containing protein, partial [Proteobacteria bacterium]
ALSQLSREVEKRKDEFYVDVLFNKSPERKINRLNIRNICKIREFYTFDDLPEKEKRWLENYYSRHIESSYHDIYKTLIDPTVETITAEFKLKVLTYIVAQELRTPKLAEALNSLSNRTIEYAFLAHEQLGTEKKVYSGEQEIMNFEGKTLEEAVKESNSSNRQSANLEAVQRLRRIAELKIDHHIMITKYNGTMGLISSDRPVHADWPLYNPDGKMNIPLDRYHMLSIYPFDEEVDPDPMKILRLDYNERNPPLFVLTYNMHQVEKADYYLYGDSEDIKDALKQYDEVMKKHMGK